MYIYFLTNFFIRAQQTQSDTLSGSILEVKNMVASSLGGRIPPASSWVHPINRSGTQETNDQKENQTRVNSNHSTTSNST